MIGVVRGLWLVGVWWFECDGWSGWVGVVGVLEIVVVVVLFEVVVIFEIFIVVDVVWLLSDWGGWVIEYLFRVVEEVEVVRVVIGVKVVGVLDSWDD
jgi:hypothetical protein